jgi:sec-independent protein translocase protein TatA
MTLTLILALLPGGMEWILIALAILLLFGGKKIPELMKGLGKGISEFKKGKNDIDKDLDD